MGTGRFIGANGDSFEGEFAYDRKLCGTYKYSDGKVYVGSWKNDKKHGQGKYIVSESCMYEGAYVEDMRQGRGKYVYPDGSVYEGDWLADLRHGQGVYTWPGGSFFMGVFHMDTMVQDKGRLVARGGACE